MSAPELEGADVYAYATPLYWAAGWRGILPLPAMSKKSPPNAYTGARGLTPSYADISEWVDLHPGGNVALRLPPDVLGIDVDSYGGKPGGLVLGHLSAKLGALPDTYRSTARTDGQSGILFYRVPPGLRWPSVLGPGIEVIRHEHRYAVVWPSLHPGDATTPAGGLYRWFGPDGELVADAAELPNPAELPELPDSWLMHFTGGELAREQTHADLARGEVVAWLEAHATGAVCRRMADAATRGLAELSTGASRHDAALTLTNRLCWLAAEGHTGAGEVLARARVEFMAAVSADRGADAAGDEWDRMVSGAVDLAAGAHPDPATVDPCLDPFAGILPPELPTASTPLAELPPQQPPTPPSAPEQPGGHPDTPEDSSAPHAGEQAPEQPEQHSSGEAGEVEAPRARTSWWPADLAAALAGEDTPPTGLTRTDGASIFYPGAINGVIGPSESGKTFVALVAMVQRIGAGEHGLVIDFEDSARGTVGRLRALGLPDDVILERVHYVRPDSALNLEALSDLEEILELFRPGFIILDGINAAMSLHGLDLMDNKDATVFHQMILRRFQIDGVVTVTVDHTPKSRGDESSGGIGAQSKRAMMTGCTVRAEPVTPFGRGQRGVIRLWVDKDRPGFVREVSAGRERRDGGISHWAGDVVLAPTPGGGIHAEVLAPEHASTGVLPSPERALMARLAQTIGDHQATEGAERMTWTEAIEATPGDNTGKRAALAKLCEGGYVALFQAPGSRGARTVELVRKYAAP